ncbi:hypothetical protein MUG12_10085 [Escherichia albertii NBRC 107761 = DSM 17582]|uniref:hypothetical protein n=1 Tax=Escherichia albertii TaxID=208962 RepID=UPI001FC881B5|nr:hypothetical protein [Escherichia albertii]MCJ2197194.1 hypothetical protein [Escherichia albertii NBRC 107761 = DSM 17582]
MTNNLMNIQYGEENFTSHCWEKNYVLQQIPLWFRNLNTLFCLNKKARWWSGQKND